MDLLLLVPPLLLLIWGMRGGALPRARVWLAAVLAAVLTGVAFMAPDLPFDDLATRLHEGDRVSETCAGEGLERSCLTTVQVGLDRGHWLVVLADLDDRTFIEKHFRELNDYAATVRGTDRPQLVLMTPTSEDDVKMIHAEFSPTFYLRHAPLALIRPLYRRLPRTLRVSGDHVVELWDGIPSLTDGGKGNQGWGSGASKGGTTYGEYGSGPDYGDEKPGDTNPGYTTPEYGDTPSDTPTPEYGDEPEKKIPPKETPVVPEYGD